jgi:hypothetical protein
MQDISLFEEKDVPSMDTVLFILQTLITAHHRMLLIYGSFNDTFNSSNYIVSNG